uniref:Rab9 effector protein with kelch motifs n=1 Tax=Pygocentrus nattereri TaxID=42514 RepID=A0AAR2L9X7_PYGNA
MGKVHFYALWSLHEAPRQFIRCLVWEGDWTLDLLAESAEKGRRGVYAKVVLTVCGEVRASFVSSTPRVSRKRLPSSQSSSFCQTLLGGSNNNNIPSQRSSPEDTVSYAELQMSKGEMQNISLGVWAVDKTPRQTIIGKRGHIWSYDGPETSLKLSQASSPKKLRLSIGSALQSQEREVVKRRSCRAEHPSKRWCHTMCLSDPDTAILIGGETVDQAHCTDSIWKLEIDGDFWLPMDSSATGPLPPSAQGHSAAFDPKSKVIYVYGGLREGQRYNDIYMLDTLTWKWKLINAKGNVPSLAYHSAIIYKSEMYVFGGLQPSRSSGGKACSNALYIFNPEHELWYQPIVEGDRPLPRFGHSTTLLPNKLVIFGGRKTAAYLNDLHILDLGFMEYTAVKYENMPPLARGFHAALPVSDNRVLISGGCSALGALQDLHLFNLDTNSWTSVVCPLLCSKPRAGHSLISLGGTAFSDIDARDQGAHHRTGPSTQFTVLVFGGSDGDGIFYNDSIKCATEILTEG